MGMHNSHASPDVVFPAWLPSPVVGLRHVALCQRRSVWLQSTRNGGSAALLTPPNSGAKGSRLFISGLGLVSGTDIPCVCRHALCETRLARLGCRTPKWTNTIVRTRHRLRDRTHERLGIGEQHESEHIHSLSSRSELDLLDLLRAHRHIPLAIIRLAGSVWKVQ